MAIIKLCLTALVVVLLCAMVGCDSSGLARVEGTVTLDGAPMDLVQLTFNPKVGGRPSMGITDKNGEYELLYSSQTKGAEIGEHDVTACTGNPNFGPPPAKNLVPAKYGRPGELTATLKKGRNTIDFKLTSD